MEFVNKATGLRLWIPKRKMKMNLCSIWPFVQISDDFYYLDIWQCARYFVTALFKELALITIRGMWGLESRPRSRTSRSRSRLLWQSLGLVSKFEPGLGLGSCGLDYITAKGPPIMFMCLAICTRYACHLAIFISEEISLFEDAIVAEKGILQILYWKHLGSHKRFCKKVLRAKAGFHPE